MHKRYTLVQFGENLESIGQLVQKMQQKQVNRSNLPPSYFLSHGFSMSYIYEGQIPFEFDENLAQSVNWVKQCSRNMHVGQIRRHLRFCRF